MKVEWSKIEEISIYELPREQWGYLEGMDTKVFKSDIYITFDDVRIPDELLMQSLKQSLESQRYEDSQRERDELINRGYSVEIKIKSKGDGKLIIKKETV
jgi:hypothetical protein